jgi:hypothetical protein
MHNEPLIFVKEREYINIGLLMKALKWFTLTFFGAVETWVVPFLLLAK